LEAVNSEKERLQRAMVEIESTYSNNSSNVAVFEGRNRELSEEVDNWRKRAEEATNRGEQLGVEIGKLR
jgi:chromosome segregation ATPase